MRLELYPKFKLFAILTALPFLLSYQSHLKISSLVFP
jgi:hypothetical protein